MARTARRTLGSARRRAGVAGAVLLAVAAVLVPVGSAAGTSPSASDSRAAAGPAWSKVTSPASGTTTSQRHHGADRPRGADAETAVQDDIARVLRSSPGAVRTGAYQVSWGGGAVVSTWAPAASSSVDRGGALGARDADVSSTASLASVGGCPDGTTVHWFCFYEHASFGGRMLQFRDCPSTQSLAAYGFANQTTSWVNNRSGVTITVYDGSTSGTVLWREYGRSSGSNVGSWANDRADTFTCRT
jgi:hypothetical protein